MLEMFLVCVIQFSPCPDIFVVTLLSRSFKMQLISIFIDPDQHNCLMCCFTICNIYLVSCIVDLIFDRHTFLRSFRTAFPEGLYELVNNSFLH